MVSAMLIEHHANPWELDLFQIEVLGRKFAERDKAREGT